MGWSILANSCCFQWFKDTNLKANHNYAPYPIYSAYVVSNGSKILIWKQITTEWWKILWDTRVVSNGSKILIWKQITTSSHFFNGATGCFQWFKDTNLKANHNIPINFPDTIIVVSNGSKILIWKQITTTSQLL